MRTRGREERRHATGRETTRDESAHDTLSPVARLTPRQCPVPRAECPPTARHAHGLGHATLHAFSMAPSGLSSARAAVALHAPRIQEKIS